MTPELQNAIETLGALSDTLTPDEKASLDERGYMVVPALLPAAQMAAMVQRFDAIAHAEGEAAGTDFHTEAGATRLGTLINKDPIFDICFLHPKAVAAVAHIMGDNFGLSSITGRAALPGEGHQALHRDNQHDSANMLWMLTDFTPENGPTRLVPGSHRQRINPSEALDDAAATHPDEIVLVAPAGTLVVINGHTWHGGTRNGSDEARYLISGFWTKRDNYQSIAHRTLSPAARARLSDAALYLIDFEAQNGPR